MFEYLHTWTCSPYPSFVYTRTCFRVLRRVLSCKSSSLSDGRLVSETSFVLRFCLVLYLISLYQLFSCTVRDVRLISCSRTNTLFSSTTMFHVRVRDLLGSSRPRPLVRLRSSILFHYSPSLWSLRYNKD